jgi:hypothetical protein
MDTWAWQPRYARLLKWKITPGTPTKSPSYGNKINFVFTNNIFVVLYPQNETCGNVLNE